MKILVQNREPDPTKWIETLNVCREKITQIYTSICTFGYLESKLKDDKGNLIRTTNAYPQ